MEPLDQETIDWLFNLINDPEVYPDQVEQIVEMKYVGNIMYVIAIDEGNPPIVPLKQLAFKFEYKDEAREELGPYEFMLLNPEEVEQGASRPQQFAAHLPARYWERIQSEEFWEAGDCAECIPDPALV